MDDELAAVRQRLETATAPDRGLDAAIVAIATGGRPEDPLSPFQGFYWTSSRSHQASPHVTQSIDDAVRLLSNVLPEWDLDLHRDFGGRYIAAITGPKSIGGEAQRCVQSMSRPTGGIAICDALLTALHQPGVK